MGSALNRSTVSNEVKTKKSKRKQQRYQQAEIPLESDAYLVLDDENNEHSQIYYYDSHPTWKNNFKDQRQRTDDSVEYQMNSNYSLDHHDVTDQSWTTSSKAYYSVYPINTFPESSPYNRQQSQPTIREERSSMKIPISPSSRKSTAKKLLSSAQSWHDILEPTFPTTETKSIPFFSRSSASRASTGTLIIPTTGTSIEKPVYIGIDFKATLAERSQINNHKTRRGRSETHHQHRHSIPVNSAEVNRESKPNKFVESQTLTRISASTGKLDQNSESKPTKSRSNHRQQLPIGDNPPKPSKTRQTKRSHPQEQRSKDLSHSTSNIQSSIRQTDRQQSETTPMRIPISLSHNPQHPIRSQK